MIVSSDFLQKKRYPEEKLRPYERLRIATPKGLTPLQLSHVYFGNCRFAAIAFLDPADWTSWVIYLLQLGC